MNILTYTRLVILDLWRMRQLVLPQILVVAGICLPILLLQGLKRGHVQELSKDLRSSPTGRTIVFWPGQRVKQLTRPDQVRLREELPRVELIVPDMQHQGELSGLRDGKSVPDVTLSTTSPGDPLLALLQCDVIAEKEKAIVLASGLAKELSVGVGDEVALTLKRSSTNQTVSTTLLVKGILAGGPGQERVGYLDSHVQDSIEHFLHGNAVPELGWTGSQQDATDEYEGYLLFCEPGTDLKKQDLDFLRGRDLVVERLKEGDDRRTLHGVFKSHDLPVYLLHRPGKLLTDDFRDILKKTSPNDDLIVPWNKPRDHRIGGATYRLVGLSLDEKDIWLSKYIARPHQVFEFGADKLSILLPASAAAGSEASIRIETPRGALAVPLKVGPPTTADGDPAVAIVPVDLLAYLNAAEAGRVVFDPISRKFNPRPRELTYLRARLYCDTIDAVPATTEALYERGYLFKAEEDRILEIQRQDASLAFIVLVVGVLVLAFGVFTITNVLADSTARKQATLGILRVMGVSRSGVFYLVVLRAILIGTLAGVSTLAIGWCLAQALRLVPVLILFDPEDLYIVFGSAVVCCILGSLYPAWKASRVDPYETIIEGKFR